jgi:hypothetical protein
MKKVLVVLVIGTEIFAGESGNYESLECVI